MNGSTYEVRPVAVGGPTRRWPIVIVAATALMLGLVVVKPWTWSGGPTAVTQAVAVEAAAAPAVAVAGPVATPAAATRAAETLGSLATHSGTWGVGNAGLGHRYDDPPWVDWTAVEPEPTSDTPSRIAMWPGTGICAGVPALSDAPLFFAVTGPLDLPVDRRLVAWWSDGGHTASLAGLIRQVTAVGDRGVSYLVRLDRAPWPAGRYEFHVEAGDRRVALTVCLTDSG